MADRYYWSEDELSVWDVVRGCSLDQRDVVAELNALESLVEDDELEELRARDAKIAQLEAVAEAAEKALAQAEEGRTETGGVARGVLFGIVSLLGPPLAALREGGDDGSS